MEERILQDPISIGILSKYTKSAIKERITRIYEILKQDIRSTKNIWETSSLQFKIGKYCGIPWGHYILVSEGVTHQPQAFLRLLLLLVLIYAGNFEKFYEKCYYILLHFCQKTTYIKALVGSRIRCRKLLKIIFRLSGRPLCHRYYVGMDMTETSIFM